MKILPEVMASTSAPVAGASQSACCSQSSRWPLGGEELWEANPSARGHRHPQHELTRGVRSMDPWGDGVRLRSTAATALARAAALISSPSRTLGVSVQGKPVPRRWPFVPRLRHHWPPDHLAMMGPPLLRREQLGLVEGSLALLCGREPPYRRHDYTSEEWSEEGEEAGEARKRRVTGAPPPTSHL